MRTWYAVFHVQYSTVNDDHNVILAGGAKTPAVYENSSAAIKNAVAFSKVSTVWLVTFCKDITTITHVKGDQLYYVGEHRHSS